MFKLYPIVILALAFVAALCHKQIIIAWSKGDDVVSRFDFDGISIDDHGLSDGLQNSRSLSSTFDPKTVMSKGAAALATPPESEYFRSLELVTETTHEEDKLCIATVDDGTIKTASVVDQHGNYHLALPDNYKTSVTVECTSYDEDNPAGKIDSKKYIENIEHSTPPPSSSACDPKQFHPGYWNEKTTSWHDQCTGMRASVVGKGPKGFLRDYFRDKPCSIVDGRKDVWMSFVSDSVGRQIFHHGLLSRINPMAWSGGDRTPRQNFMLHSFGTSEYKVTLTFTFDSLLPSTMSTYYNLPYSWGDFVRERGVGPFEHDPEWSNERVPDVLFFSPGYHASHSNSTEYGNDLEGILVKWYDVIVNKYNAPAMPPMHLLLNMMPAPWMIPGKYAEDRKHRTLLNEYRKNLAIINTAKKFDFVQSVVDVFSIELPFNAKAHMDAVHIGDHRILRIIANFIADAFCWS